MIPESVQRLVRVRSVDVTLKLSLTNVQRRCILGRGRVLLWLGDGERNMRKEGLVVSASAASYEVGRAHAHGRQQAVCLPMF